MQRTILKGFRGNLTQKDVARAIGVSDKTISALENGYVNPSFKVALLLSKYYNVPINQLFPDLFTSEKLLIENTE